MYCDLHGHSIKRNVFLYGCDAKYRTRTPRRASGNALMDAHHPKLQLLFPYLLHKKCDAFSLTDCSFKIQKSKAATSRVVNYREYGIDLSYTMEASFMGSSSNEVHFRSQDLEQIGRDWCSALLDLSVHLPDAPTVNRLIREAEALIEPKGGVESDYTSSEDETVTNPHLDVTKPSDPALRPTTEGVKYRALREPEDINKFADFLRASGKQGGKRRSGGTTRKKHVSSKLSMAEIMRGGLSKLHAQQQQQHQQESGAEAQMSDTVNVNNGGGLAGRGGGGWVGGSRFPPRYGIKSVGQSKLIMHTRSGPDSPARARTPAIKCDSRAGEQVVGVCERNSSSADERDGGCGGGGGGRWAVDSEAHSRDTSLGWMIQRIQRTEAAAATAAAGQEVREACIPACLRGR